MDKETIKRIEREAAEKYPLDDPKKNIFHDNSGQYSRREAYIAGATAEREKDFPSMVEKFASEGVFIEIVCDGFKDGYLCYRPCYSYFSKIKNYWITNDIGCYKEMREAVSKIYEFAEQLILKLSADYQGGEK
jgi:hypothetical protein